MSRLCLLVMCGIPGSGKTTLCKKILSDMRKCSKAMARWIHVCFDDIFPAYLENKALEVEGSWRGSREVIKQSMDDLLRYLITGESIKSEPSLYSTACGPQSSHHQIRDLFQQYVVDSIPTGDSCDDVQSVLLIDDNMYYKSMRYEYYQLARKYNIGFAELHVMCDISTARFRNSLRPNPLPDDIIITMAARMEAPSRSNEWEEHSIAMDTSSSDELSFPLEDIYKLVNNSLANPVTSTVGPDPDAAQASRKLCSQNVLHQADQILRKCISERLCQLKGVVSKQTFIQEVTACQRVKSELLSELRDGTLLVPSHLNLHSHDASQQHSNPLYLFIRDMFHEKLS